MPAFTASMVAGFRARSAGAGKGTGAFLSVLTRWGWTRRPPLPTAAASRAIWTAVTVTPPWPMETDTVSPGNHCTFWVRIFHAGLGMRPLVS